MQDFNDQSEAYDFYGDISIPLKKTFSRFALSILSYTLISYAIILLAQIIIIFSMGVERSAAFFENSYVIWIFNSVPTYMIALPVLYLLVRKMPVKRLKKSNIGIGEFVLLFLVAQTFMVAGNLIGVTLNGIIGIFTGTPPTNAIDELITSSPVWLITLVAVIIGPICEEFIFRKLMIDRLSRYGNVTAIIVSAVAFGLFHGNLYQFFYATLIGLLLGYLYVKTGNWIYPAVMHILINLYGSLPVIPISKASELIAVMGEQLAAGIEINLLDYYRSVILVASYGIINYGMVIAGAVILFQAIRHRRIHINSDCEIYVPRNTLIKSILLNIGVILYVVFSLLLFVLSVFQ